MTIIYPGPGPWGPGKDGPLTKAEFGGNFYDHEVRITDLETNPPQPNDIVGITLTGSFLSMTQRDGTILGPVPFSPPMARWRSEWAIDTSYIAFDFVTVSEVGLFGVLQDHTSSHTAFDANATDIDGNLLYRKIIGFSGTTATIDDLLDVVITSAANKDMLVYDSGSTHWVNKTPTQVTANLLGSTSGILTANGSGVLSSITPASGVATFLATPSSANLRGAITDETGTGAAVFATSPALVTPDIGTPSAGTLTNATGLPVATGISGLGTGIATFLATPSSANLRGALTDEVGTGAAYFVGGALGTPASATLTNATGLPVSTGISGFGTGVATFLGTPTSANLAAALTDETGSGAAVFATSPTLVTPALGTPSSGDATNLTNIPVANATGTLAFGHGGTGQTSYTDGQLLIGNTATGGLSKATLTAGSNVTITNGNGTITIASSGGGGGGSPGGSSGDIQTNNGAGGFGSITPASGVATFLATPSSANLRTVLTDETGTGAAVFATSPALVTPDLGTPSAATLTSATGLPISTGVSGLGSGVATFLATPSSANLRSALTDETGTGAAVFATSPTLVTPLLGTPTSGDLSNCTNIPVANATGTLPVANGGTGQTSYTNGQLLIGNTTGNTLAKGTLTAGTAITITNGGGSITIAGTSPATAQSTPSNPATTTSTTGVMMGLAGSITPARSGTVVFQIAGSLSNNTASRGCTAYLRYGTGSAPTNGAALTGTRVDNEAFHDAAAASLSVPFCISRIVTGLSIGTTYWFDASLASRTSGTSSLFSPTLTAYEI